MDFENVGSGAGMLKRALLGNALFSAACGLLVVAFDADIAALLGVAGLVLWPLGAMLLGFALYLAWFATRSTLNSGWVTSIIVSDLAWVAGTAILLLGWYSVLSTRR